MDSKINDILLKLQDGKIDVNKTVKEIESIHYDIDLKEDSKKRARKLKILINTIDDNDGKNFRLNLPGLPFWFLKSLCVPFIKFVVKHGSSKGAKESNVKEDKVKNINVDDLKKLKYVFEALGQLPPFEIVNIDSKDTKVHIYTK